MNTNKIPNVLRATWQRWRQEGARNGRYIPLRITIFLVLGAISVLLAAFTLPALFTHYQDLVPDYPNVSRAGIALPEFIAFVLLAIAVFSQYEKIALSAFKKHLFIILFLLLHAGLIYAGNFALRHEARQIQAEVDRRRQVADDQTNTEIKRADGQAGIRLRSVTAQAELIRRQAEIRAADNRAAGNLRMATQVLNAAEDRIAKLFAEANAGTKVSASGIAPVDVDEVRAKMTRTRLDWALDKVRVGSLAYLNSPVAILAPLVLAILFLKSVMGALWVASAHERASANLIRGGAQEGTYQGAEGAGAAKPLPGWSPMLPPAPELRPATVPPGSPAGGGPPGRLPD